MRTEDDQWGITESVGATALGVASGRAMEHRRTDGLVDDPYAAAFVDAAGSAGGTAALPTDPTDDPAWAELSSYIGVRSRFFDRFLVDAAAAGIRQVVLLAAGLDTRAQRLDWPEGTVVYEVDQQGVLEFKDRVLDEVGAPAMATGTGAGTGSAVPDPEETARRVTVPVDLRHDWPGALRAAGFDPSRPTAWLAEGLLPYLPAQAEADLFDRVEELSAPASRIAVEHFGDSIAAMTDDEDFAALSQRFGVDVRELFPDDGARADPADLLGSFGWDVTPRSAAALARDYGRPLDAAQEPMFGAVVLLAARHR